MAAAGLTRGQPAAGGLRGLWPAGLTRAWIACCSLVWALTLAGAAATRLADRGLRGQIRALLELPPRLRPAPAPQLAHLLPLAAHNVPIAAWPLLLAAAGAHRNRIARRGGDVLLAAALIANTLPVGAALALDGTRLLAYLPQLPLEWATLAFGAAGWVRQRRRPLSASQGLCVFALIAALTLAAAAIETTAVPHR
jgi:hypothetical protein